jgi:hypothetical protein
MEFGADLIALIAKPKKQVRIGTCHLGPPSVPGWISAREPFEVGLCQGSDYGELEAALVEGVPQLGGENVVNPSPGLIASLPRQVSLDKRACQIWIFEFGEGPIQSVQVEAKKGADVTSVARRQGLVVPLAIGSRPNDKAGPVAS